MRVAVIIPVHCETHIIQLTLGSLLRACGAKHDLNIHLGVHSNYGDYTKDRIIFEQFRGVAQFHLIDEVPWLAVDGPRYSRMHAKQLRNLLTHIRYYDFDYVLLLDNDVLIKQDIVSALLALQPDGDLIASCRDDQPSLYVRTWPKVDANTPSEEWVLPQPSPWHLLLSRRLYQAVLAQLSVVDPEFLPAQERGRRLQFLDLYHASRDLPLSIDTCSRLLHACRFEWPGYAVKLLSATEFDTIAHHFFFSSFNYGQNVHGIAGHNVYLQTMKATYDREFPNGIDHLLKMQRCK